VPGAIHGVEIPYAFDNVQVALGERTSEADRAMAGTMSGYWASFVRTGNPNGGGRPEWPRYDPGVDRVLNFTNDGVAVGPDPLRARLDLWQAVWEPGN
jgi:para-nitrobenzyl esterase